MGRKKVHMINQEGHGPPTDRAEGIFIAFEGKDYAAFGKLMRQGLGTYAPWGHRIRTRSSERTRTHHYDPRAVWREQPASFPDLGRSRKDYFVALGSFESIDDEQHRSASNDEDREPKPSRYAKPPAPDPVRRAMDTVLTGHAATDKRTAKLTGALQRLIAVEEKRLDQLQAENQKRDERIRELRKELAASHQK